MPLELAFVIRRFVLVDDAFGSQPIEEGLSLGKFFRGGTFVGRFADVFDQASHTTPLVAVAFSAFGILLDALCSRLVLRHIKISVSVSKVSLAAYLTNGYQRSCTDNRSNRADREYSGGSS